MTIIEWKLDRSAGGKEYYKFTLELNIVGGGRLRQTGWRYYIESGEVVEPRTAIGGHYLKTTSALDGLRERAQEAINSTLAPGNLNAPVNVLSDEDIAGMANVAASILASSDRGEALERLGKSSKSKASAMREWLRVYDELERVKKT